MNKKIKTALLCAMSISILSACGKEKEPDYAEVDYLDQAALQQIGTYKDITDKAYKESKNAFKDEYVKWTATVSKVESDKKFSLKEDELPRVDVKLKAKPKEQLVKEGDVVTIAGKIVKYEYGLFDRVPYWALKDAKVLEVTETEKGNLTAYQTAYADQVKAAEIAETAEIKKQEEAVQKEQAENKAEAVRVYQEEITPALAEIERDYDAIWSDLWIPAFNGIANGTVDAYTAYDYMKKIQLHYDVLQIRLSEVKTDQFTGDAKKAFAEYHSSYYSAMSTRIAAAKKAMKLFDEGTYKPSDIEKINKEVAMADMKIVKVVASRFELEEALGILEPGKKQ